MDSAWDDVDWETIPREELFHCLTGPKYQDIPEEAAARFPGLAEEARQERERRQAANANFQAQFGAAPANNNNVPDGAAVQMMGQNGLHAQMLANPNMQSMASDLVNSISNDPNMTEERKQELLQQLSLFSGGGTGNSPASQ